MPSNGSEREPLMAIFDVKLIAVDHPTERQRWDGGPMPSKDADAVLKVAVEAFRDAIRAAGFEIARIGYGVCARRPDVAAAAALPGTEQGA